LFSELFNSQGPWGLLLSSLAPVKPDENKPSHHKLTKAEQSQFTLSDELNQILAGLLLGDLGGQKQNVNARFDFKQGIVHEDYIDHLYELFKDYCPQAPKIFNLLPDKRTGKVHSFKRFQTYSLPCFNELYEIFYPLGVKIVPLEIALLLTALSLAYWICDDGSWHKRGGSIILSTDGFTLEEVKLLVSVLNKKWNLNCTINKHGDGFRIRIPKKSVPIVQALLQDIMPPMMKLRIKNKIGL